MSTTIACVKVGSLYGPEYVNRLKAMVRRHTTRPYRFLCLTDDPTGVSCATAPIGTNVPGWWAKLVVFQPHPALEGDRCLFLDLDTVIMDNMDFLLDYGGEFAILRDFYQPREWGSAIMSVAPGFGEHIWRQFNDMPLDVMTGFWGDQAWIRQCLARADLWQELFPGKIGSYKADALADSPREFAVCCFHGTPKPHQVNGWVAEHWRE
jgi:hypothetical protein